MPKLVIFRGDAVENEIRVGRNTVRIGRHNRNDVVLDDGLNGVSRFHAEIRVEGGAYSIVDMNSRNGVWISGRRIKDMAALTIGVPVTIGAFELALEDDVSSADFSDSGHTMVAGVGATATDRKDAPNRSAVRKKAPAPAMSARTKQAILWSAAAAAVVLLCVVTFAFFRYRSQPPPETTVAVVQPPPQVVEPVPDPAPPVDPNVALNEQALADARAKIDAKDYATALRDYLQPLLERDPENAEALEMKRVAEQALAALPPKTPRPTPPKETPVVETETPGIPRKPNEAFADYQARVKRVQTAFASAKANLDKQEYAAALAQFRAVHADQPNYNGVDVIYAEAVRQQQKALEEAMVNGQRGEQAGDLKLARQWYLRAQDVDPTSTSAREKHASIFGRMNSEATKLFNAAGYAQKSQETAAAIQKFQQVVDLMLPGDEIRTRAMKELEGLRR